MVFSGMLSLLLEPPILVLAIGILLQTCCAVQEFIMKLKEKNNT